MGESKESTLEGGALLSMMDIRTAPGVNVSKLRWEGLPRTNVLA